MQSLYLTEFMLYLRYELAAFGSERSSCGLQVNTFELSLAGVA